DARVRGHRPGHRAADPAAPGRGREGGVSMAAPRAGRTWLGRLAAETEEGTAAGIYGVVVSSAVLATAHANSALALDAAVVVTLVVYWGAERYSRLVAQRIHDGQRPHFGQVRAQLTGGWEMVTASFLPLVVVIVVRGLGVSLNAAVVWGLTMSTVLLFVAGWEIGRDSQL